ncbi:MAG: hypothetical protein LIO45_06595 [Clostridiales bacterium]|nr:hypothetical protein [Clostridiales bacterium]
MIGSIKGNRHLPVAKYPIARYQYHYKVRHKSLCDGQSGYTVSTLDKIVDEAIRTKFASIQAAPQK